MNEEKKGITVKIDAALHAEVRQYLEQNGMTMAEFIALSANHELHPKMVEKEEKEMGKMRTLAFQVTEDLFQKIKEYLLRHNMTQKQFVLGLIEAELEREQTEQETPAEESMGCSAKETKELDHEQPEEEYEDLDEGIKEYEEDEEIDADYESEELEDEEPEESENGVMGMSM